MDVGIDQAGQYMQASKIDRLIGYRWPISNGHLLDLSFMNDQMSL